MKRTIDAGEAVKLIEQMGLKKAYVAGEIGVNPGTLSRFLNGKGQLGKSAMILLCQVLHVKDRAG